MKSALYKLFALIPPTLAAATMTIWFLFLKISKLYFDLRDLNFFYFLQ